MGRSVQEDADAAALVEGAMERDGVTFVRNAKIKEIVSVDSSVSEIRLSVNGVVSNKPFFSEGLLS